MKTLLNCSWVKPTAHHVELVKELFKICWKRKLMNFRATHISLPCARSTETTTIVFFFFYTVTCACWFYFMFEGSLWKKKASFYLDTFSHNASCWCTLVWALCVPCCELRKKGIRGSLPWTSCYLSLHLHAAECKLALQSTVFKVHDDVIFHCTVHQHLLQRRFSDKCKPGLC